MDGSESNPLNVELDIMGQQPLLRIYTQISLIFAHPPSIPDSTILQTLTHGLERLSASFPWAAGQVINEGATEDNTGMFKIKPFEPIPRMTVKDLRDDPSTPTLDQMREAQFPMHMLDEDAIAPRRTLPGGPGYSPTDPEPVLLLQANFIKGGLILTVNGQHACMDMVGQESVIRLLHKACRGEEFTPEELAYGNLERPTVLPLLEDTWQPGSELDDQLIDFENPPPPPNMDASQVLFSFSPASLAALKLEASKSLAKDTKFVSTDDALTAFIWKSTCRVRLNRLDPTIQTTFARAIDVRKACGAHPAYPGLLQNMTYNKVPISELITEPLGITASRLRSQLNPQHLKWRTQALSTALARTPNKSIFSIAAKVNPGSDIQLSSWAKIDLWLDFGLGLGKPESVRRPHFTPLEGLMYLMPKTPEGEISAAIALRNEDLEGLKRDEEFMKYAKYLG